MRARIVRGIVQLGAGPVTYSMNRTHFVRSFLTSSSMGRIMANENPPPHSGRPTLGILLLVGLRRAGMSRFVNDFFHKFS